MNINLDDLAVTLEDAAELASFGGGGTYGEKHYTWTPLPPEEQDYPGHQRGEWIEDT
jgi:hypothetical protein